MVEDNLKMREELRTVKYENQKLRSDVSCNVKEIERLRNIVQQLEEEKHSEKKAAHSDQLLSSSKEPTRPLAVSPVFKGAFTQPHRPEKEICQTQLQIQAIQNSLAQYAIAIDEVRLRQNVPDVKTTNGLYIWKIPDICQSYRDAVDGKTVSLYSPPFYTSSNGYCVRIRTYLNGDGIGKGTHISVFFFIMRSKHDNMLSWPFKQSVRFTLINQKNPAASITEAFVPDLHSPSFQKPDYDMNIAIGFPKFAPQGVLQDENFTLNSTLIIHCQCYPNGLVLL